LDICVKGPMDATGIRLFEALGPAWSSLLGAIRHRIYPRVSLL
jgi:hypothetical protein